MESYQRKHNLQFRRVRPEDAPKLRDFWANLSPASQRTYRPYGEKSDQLAPWQEAAERYAAGPDIGIAAVTPQETIAGLCIVEWIGRSERLPNFGIGVDDHYQGLGVGAQLMEITLGEADKLGVPVIKLIVVNYNRPAQHLYRKFGFRYAGEPHREADGLIYFDMLRAAPNGPQENVVADESPMAQRHWVVHVVPGSHFDVGWVATPAETYAYGDEIIRSAIDAITGSTPGYHFTVEYSSYMAHFLASYPQYRETARRLVDEGKLEVCASVTGLMHQVLDGELMVRQIVYSQEWAEQALGRRLITTQHTDLSGYTLQFPQVLARSGVRHLAYSRFHPPIRLHWWQAPDGSRVLAANHPNHYGWGLTLRSEQRVTRIPQQLASVAASWPVDDILMGDETDCLMGDPTVVEKGAELEALGIAKFRVATISQFFAAVADADLPTYQGEAPYAIYSIHAANPDTYLEARQAENRLAAAEKLSALRELAGLGRYPFAAIRRAWEELFYPHDHNVGGRHGKLNTELRRTAALSSRVAADQVLQEGMLQLITHIAYAPKENGVAMVVYNPLSWPRTDVVRTYVELRGRGKNGLRVTGAEGKEMICQVLQAESSGDRERIDHIRRDWSWMDIQFVAEDVPPLGYRVYYLYPLDDGTAGTVWRQPPPSGLIDGRHFRLKLGEDGAIHSLVWKEKDIDFAGKGEYKFNEVYALEDLRMEIEIAHEAERANGRMEPTEERRLNFTGKAWRSHLQAQRIEEGPLHTKVVLQGIILDAPVTQEIILYHDQPRVDFMTRIDWRGAMHAQVRIAYPFNVPGGKTTYEVPFGTVQVGKDELPGGYDGAPRFVQKWIDLSNDDYGVTFATRSGGHSLEGEAICPIVLRSTYTEAEMDFWYENKGTFEFAFSVRPHTGSWQDGRTYRQGWEFNNPLLAGSLTTKSNIFPIPGRANLPETLSLCQVTADNVVVTSLGKPSQDSDQYMMRLFEVVGKAQEVACRFQYPLRRAWKTNLLGDPEQELAVHDNEIRFPIAPYEIAQCVLEFETVV
jgi:alpha-mannosidase